MTISNSSTIIVGLIDPFGKVEARRMFGGFGIFDAGLMITLIFDDSQYS